MTPSSVDAARESADAVTESKAMHEIRLVGRGGQGVVTAGDLLGKAAILEGRHAQSIPTFGPERRGALSSCTLRIADGEILLKCSSMSPDVLLVLDPTIWHHANVLLGFQAGGKLIFNSPLEPKAIDAELKSGQYGYRPAVDEYELFAVDATGIAMELLGRPITNTAMMGALVGATRLLRMESVEASLEERFGKKAEQNIRAARASRDALQKLGG